MVKTLQKKILLSLHAGLALFMTRSPSRQWYILKTVIKDWKSINKYSLERSIRQLYKSKLVSTKENADGSTTMILTEKGKLVALRYNLDTLVVHKQPRWDRKWRIVMFDIPEKYAFARKSLREHFKKMGLVMYQKSVFVTPYPCRKEIEFLIEFHHVKPYVRYLECVRLDNELHLKTQFKINV